MNIVREMNMLDYDKTRKRLLFLALISIITLNLAFAVFIIAFGGPWSDFLLMALWGGPALFFPLLAFTIAFDLLARRFDSKGWSKLWLIIISPLGACLVSLIIIGIEFLIWEVSDLASEALQYYPFVISSALLPFVHAIVFSPRLGLLNEKEKKQ